MTDRRYTAGRPYYRKDQAVKDEVAAVLFGYALTFIVGSLCGVTIARMWG